MRLDIILRTHDGRNVHGGQRLTEALGASKQELIVRCLRSLVDAINVCTLAPCQMIGNADIGFTILDDHSSPRTLARIKAVLGNCKVKPELHSLEGRGNNRSLLRQFVLARQSRADYVYCVEDDYMHFPDGLKAMLETAGVLVKLTGNENISLHPDDDVWNYRKYDPCRVVAGSDRLWRTNVDTTGTFMTPPKIINDNWGWFEMLAAGYGENGIHEGNTINHVWRTKANLFTPLMPCAVHMGCDAPPFCGWQDLWDQLGEDHERRTDAA